MSIYSIVYSLLEKNILPEAIIRQGVRRLIKQRVTLEQSLRTKITDYDTKLLNELKSLSITSDVEKANEQHYEVPAAFYQQVLGKNLKHSCSLWDNDTADLDTAEIRMLNLYCKRAELIDGQNILELGCGWGSLTLHLAQKLPNSMITAISNSSPQRQYILEQAKKRGLKNIQIMTSDIKIFEPNEKFDRIISIEMFEHVRNHNALFAKLSQWLKNDGKMFIHIFCHKNMTYLFDPKDDSDWMSRHFFSGGIMPAKQLFEQVQDSLKLIKTWTVNGTHYQKTSEAWLRNMKMHHETIIKLFQDVYGAEANKFMVYWRVFFIACAETFGYNKGEDWFVCHYLFGKSA